MSLSKKIGFKVCHRQHIFLDDFFSTWYGCDFLKKFIAPLCIQDLKWENFSMTATNSSIQVMI